MKTFLKTVAWIGSVIMISGAIIAFRESWILYFKLGHNEVPMTYLVTFWICLTGLALMLIGGLFSNPRFFWIMCTFAGVFYIASSFYAYTRGTNWGLEEFGIFVVPGLVAILEGIWLKLKKIPCETLAQ